MRRTTALMLGVISAVGMAGMAIAGSIDSPGAPSSGSAMYTLSQVYDYLNSGIVATPVAGFQEPAGTPGPTMKTARDIYDSIMAKFGACNVTAADVRSGVKFFSTQSGSWGVQTGTAP